MTLPTQKHLRNKMQAEHNICLLNEACFPDPCNTGTIPYLDWNITISFYVALHYVHSYLARNGYRTDFDSHKERNDYLKDNVSLRDSKIDRILSTYIDLYKLSKIYRYTACQYYYPNQTIACKYRTFALQDLPRILGI